MFKKTNRSQKHLPNITFPKSLTTRQRFRSNEKQIGTGKASGTRRIDLSATNARIVDLRAGGLAGHSTRGFAKVADKYAVGWKEIAILDHVDNSAIKFLKKVD